MIVHHAGCLHERVADGRAHKTKAAPSQILAHRIRSISTARRPALMMVRGVFSRPGDGDPCRNRRHGSLHPDAAPTRSGIRIASKGTIVRMACNAKRSPHT